MVVGPEGVEMRICRLITGSRPAPQCVTWVGGEAQAPEKVGILTPAGALLGYYHHYYFPVTWSNSSCATDVPKK